jgi:hypothetical protein
MKHLAERTRYHKITNYSASDMGHIPKAPVEINRFKLFQLVRYHIWSIWAFIRMVFLGFVLRCLTTTD